jgi:hypothetical protein
MLVQVESGICWRSGCGWNLLVKAVIVREVEAWACVRCEQVCC